MDYAYTALQNKENIQLIPDTNPGIMHHKVFIIDEKTVVTGSMNPTQNGNERNDENILILHDEDIAKQYIKELERRQPTNPNPAQTI